MTIIIYLIWSIGHEKEKEGICLGSIDNIPYELMLFGVGCIVVFFSALAIFAINSFNDLFINLIIAIGILSYLAIYVSLLVAVVTTIRRIKAKKFWKSFLIYKIGIRVIAFSKNIIRTFTEQIDEKGKKGMTRKTIISYIAFLIVTLILITWCDTFFGVVLTIVFWVWTCYKLLEYNKQVTKIRNALNDIYEGKKDVYLNEEELKGVLKEMARYINDIAGGFSNAIEQSLKSERLKTELITNVSHDIKTPLTSIINYVDLLKKEEFQNKQIEQYIAILDAKSQRLKKLIEDLVEASKVSSGNVKLNIETINLKELIHQSIGEFEDRFEKKNLNLDISMPEEVVTLQADSRYMYRIIENLFSNITKYAMENSRVYISLKKENGKIEISMKNVSSQKLNISAEELKQRFVRADKSRYTEGSGLGLSIAESLTEIQGGKFEIYIDGDLFKVILQW